MQFIKDIFNAAILVKRYICAFLLTVMLIITFIQVVLRYFFNAPFSWSEEVTLMLLVSFGYLCMSMDIFTDSHAAIYFIYNLATPRVRKILDLLRHGLLTFFFFNMIRYGLVITRLNWYKRQPASGFSYGWLALPLVVGGIFMIAYSIFNFISSLVNPQYPYD